MNDAENHTTSQSQEDRYAEVSLRAVELLAKAQRAADEAVAEAQSYARDLEKSAREQYKQILQRAQTAAQQVANAEGARGDQAGAGGTGSVDAQQLVYVRTYARVAHTQLKSVLAALNDELDQLAAMAEGASPDAAPPAPLAPPPGSAGRYGSAPEPAPAPPQSAPQSAPRIEPAWQPSDPPASNHAPQASAGTSTWPPIATSPSSISFFHRGSTWVGPQ